MKKLLALALLASFQAAAQTEIILDNESAAFSTTGTWPTSTAVAGYVGSNYQTHEANGAPPGAIVVDNTDSGFTVTGTWTASTAVSGYLGTNYQHHFANGEPPSAVVADNLAGTFTGTWPTSTSVGGYYATNYQTHAAGTGTTSFTWTLNVASAGTYEVYGRWTQHANRATNAKYTVNHAGGASLVTVNQRVNGSSWQLLGTYSFNAGTATVSLSDDADGYVIADAVMIVLPGAAPSTATWSAAIPSSGSYEVYARWTQHPNRATNAKYTVNHSGGSTLVTVNQMAGGGAWILLGAYNFNAGAATVGVTDQADGYVIADAVMFLPPGASANTATWTPNVAQAGQYEVYARWTEHPNRASDASYTVTHAGGSTAVAVNQQAGGGAWNLLGTFALSPGTAHKVTLTDQANGYVIADAIRLVPVVVQAEQKLYFVHTDHLNTPRLVADATGTTVWRWDQAEPFGNNAADENPSGLGAFDLPLRLPGQQYDKETGLHYNYFRDYDPSLGIYKQSDPIGLDGGLNTYAYVHARPIELVDPEGLEVRVICRNLTFPGNIGSWAAYGRQQKHCFVQVICPQEGINAVLSLFGEGSSIPPTRGRKAKNDTRDNPYSGGIKDNVAIIPSNPECRNCCRYEREVLSRFERFPSGSVAYEATGWNSNSFAEMLVTSATCRARIPYDHLNNAPGFGIPR